MSQTVDQLEPRNLWRYFAKISEIPRCSKEEEAIAEWLASVGKDHGAEVSVDPTGNVLLRLAATPGCEQAPGVVLQNHMDMVCEKNSDVQHDFDRDAVQMVIEGDIVKAKGTTLGADNGIGMAAALAFLDEPDATHGPLELLFTVDEETGLTGAFEIEAGFISSRIMLNLDSEDWGIFTIGSAGGRDTTLTYKAPRGPRAGTELFELAVSGLQGGHSGQDIILNRGNSIKILARIFLMAAEDETLHGISVGAFAGGSKRNALPREARAIVSIPAGASTAFRELVQRTTDEIRSQLEGIESSLEVRIRSLKEKTGGSESAVCSPEDSLRLIHLLNALPHGVLAMSTEIENLVETSTNLGVLVDQEDGYQITLSTRSSVAEALTAVLAQIRSAARLAGAQVLHGDGYPAWKPKLGTPLLKTVEDVYERLHGGKPAFKAIHAGLECGLFLGKYPDLQVISFGPDIKEPHSPNERVYIASVAKFWTFTKALLAALANPKK
ncbi:MAG: aminoacyl-histidine dipeptidase [Candidatus Eisenbacteria sp.]|nr:aminoacyl-histidine dipeptidase [Candidatus Eisenbacteria bacterium]